MAEIEDRGLLLRRIAYGESSLICHVLTANYGRIALMAKGARRPKSPFRATLAPLHDLKLRWRTGRTGMGTLIDLQRGGALLPETQSLCGLELLSVASRLFQEGDPHGFTETCAALNLLSNREGQQAMESALWYLLDQAGLVGEMEACWQCGRETTGLMYWRQGVLLCDRCGDGSPVSAGLRRSIAAAPGARVRFTPYDAAAWRGMIISLLKVHGIKAPDNLFGR